MRALTLISLLVLFSIASVLRAQESQLPPCSVAELETAYDILPGYESMTELALEIETFDDLLAYSDIQLEWRSNTWLALPLCAEIHDMGVLMSQNSDAIVSATLLEIIGVVRDDNPYVEQLYSGVDELQARGQAIIAAVESGAASGLPSAADEGLTSCSTEQLQNLRDKVLPGFQGVMGQGMESIETDSSAVIIRYIEAMIDWRDGLWEQLPPCADAYRIGMSLYNLTSDVSKISILEYAGVSRGSNPYQSDFLRGFVRVVELSDWLDASGEGYYSLLPCSESSIDIELYEAFKQYLDLSEPPGDSLDALIMYGEAHTAWRDALWAQLPKLPGCAEAFETALLTVQLTGDTAAFTAISHIVYDFLDLARPYQDRVFDAGDRIGELDALLAIVWKTESAPVYHGLPACSAAEIEAIAGSVTEFSDLLDLGLAIDTPAELAAYIKSQFTWRDRLWLNLTGCAAHFDIALLMLQTAGDLAINAAFNLAGVPQDANPYAAQISGSRGQIESWLQARDGGPDKAPAEEAQTAGKTYYVTANPYANIRTCAATSCSIVTTAQNGEALTVVDDSSDWYELRLDDGGTGYIAGFLMSETRPGS